MSRRSTKQRRAARRRREWQEAFRAGGDYGLDDMLAWMLDDLLKKYDRLTRYQRFCREYAAARSGEG